jgi:hypothetical protein
MMRFPDVCDKYCAHRVVGCHSVCPKYLGAKAAHDAKNDLIYREKLKEKDANNFRREGMIKNIRHRRDMK